jgi:hypothetical protein
VAALVASVGLVVFVAVAVVRVPWEPVPGGGPRSLPAPESVLPAAVKARVSIEAGLGLTWRPYVGDAGRSISIEHFGASADYKTLYREFGITTEAVVAAAQESLAAAS